MLINESNQFKDIVQEDFMDTYKNLTTKTVRILVKNIIYLFIVLKTMVGDFKFNRSWQ